jgi:hypothetical protein
MMSHTDKEIRATVEVLQGMESDYGYHHALRELLDDVFDLMAQRDAALAELSRSRESAAWLIDRAWDKHDAILAVTERVRVLHRPWAAAPFCLQCEICGPDVGRAADDQYPCATLRVLDAVPTEEVP